MRKFEAAYKALDKANLSIANNRFMKAISEFNEALFNLNETKISPRFRKEVENKIAHYRNMLGSKEKVIPTIADVKLEHEALPESEEEILKARIEARRAERASRVRNLLHGKRGEKKQQKKKEK